MMLEFIITLEVIAFVCLILGLIPFKPVHDAGNLPLINKILFMLVAMILFFVLALNTATIDYEYCYVNNSTTLDDGTVQNNTACETQTVTDTGLSYVNWGMGVVSLVLGFIIMLMGWIGRFDKYMTDSEE